MAIKVAVCDDQQFDRKQISDYINQFQVETGTDIQVFYFSNGEDLIENMPRDTKILLLDIQMGGINGINVARTLREEGLDFYLLFFTHNTQYALEGYEVHAYAFLCKPLQYTLFKKYMQEVIVNINKSNPAIIEIRANDSIHLIDCTQVVYFEVFGHVSKIHFEDGSVLETKMSLEQLNKIVGKYGFFRCHKSYLINLKKIKSFKGNEIIMKNGQELPLSRKQKQEFLLSLHKEINV